MTLLTLCQSIQSTPFSTAVRESTWGFPVLAALHVLALAWFGGTLVLRGETAAQLGAWRWTDGALLLGTGALLFCIEPVKCYESVSFRVKMGLLLLAAVTPRRRALALLLWAAVVFAARGIAFY